MSGVGPGNAVNALPTKKKIITVHRSATEIPISGRAIKANLIELFDPDVSHIQLSDGFKLDSEQARLVVGGIGIIIHQDGH